MIKIGVGTVPPLWFACLRYAVAAACLVVVVTLRGEMALPSRSDWSLIAVSGVLQMAAYSALTALALTHLPPGRASVLAFSTPLWVVPMSMWWLRERISVAGRIGVVAGLVGVLVVASPALERATRDQLVPYLLLLMAAAGWAMSIMFVRIHRFQGSALSLAPWQMLVAVLLLLPFAIAVDGPLPAVDMRGLTALAYVGPLATAFAYWAMVEVGRDLRATTISVTLLAVPAIGLLISSVTFRETVSVSLGIGVALITGGVLLTTGRSQ